jgi:hypothetical protein
MLLEWVKKYRYKYKQRPDFNLILFLDNNQTVKGHFPNWQLWVLLELIAVFDLTVYAKVVGLKHQFW